MTISWDEDHIASLPPHMAWTAMLQVARKIESLWQLDGHEDRILELTLRLKQLSKHDLDPQIPRFATSLRNREMSVTTFVAGLVPFERRHSRGVVDYEILHSPTDRRERSGPLIPLAVVLDNIRSAFNVGSILRTSECLGARVVYLSGYTSTPDEAKTQKTSLGVEHHVNWQKVPSTRELLVNLRNEGYTIYAAEISQQSQSIFETTFAKPCAIIFGNERYGLDPDILDAVDKTVFIPMAGIKNSLNVGVAFGVMGFEIFRQWLQH